MNLVYRMCFFGRGSTIVKEDEEEKRDWVLISDGLSVWNGSMSGTE